MKKLSLETIQLESYETSGIPESAGTVNGNMATNASCFGTCLRSCPADDLPRLVRERALVLLRRTAAATARRGNTNGRGIGSPPVRVASSCMDQGAVAAVHDSISTVCGPPASVMVSCDGVWTSAIPSVHTATGYEVSK